MDSRKERKPFSLIASLREKMFHYLPARDAFALAATCRDWARSLKGPYFERIASAEFPKIRVLRALLSSPKPSFKEMYTQQLAARQGEERVVASSLADYVFTLEISLPGNDEKEEDEADVKFTWVGEAADLSSSNVVLSFKHQELHACKYVYDVTSQPDMLDCEIEVHMYATSRSSGHTVLVASPCVWELSSCDGEKVVFTGGQKQGIYSTWEQFGDNSESGVIFPYIPTYINELLNGGMTHSVHLEWDLEMHFGCDEARTGCNQLKLSEVVFTPSLIKSADWGEIKQKIPQNDFFAMFRSSLN